MNSLVLDTSALMECGNIIDKLHSKYDNIIVPIVVIEELDNLKTNRDYDKATKARHAIKHILHNKNLIRFDLIRRIAVELTYDNTAENHYNTNDDIIVTSAFYNRASLCTCDLNLQIKAEALGVEVVECPSDILYRGYKRVIVSDEEMAHIYSEPKDNTYNLLVNEYLIMYNEQNEFVDNLKWTDEGYKKVSYKNIKTRMFGNIKAKDEYQACALDSLDKNEITVLYGRAGSGKTQLALSYLMKLLEAGDIRKIYIIYSYDTLRGAKTLGYEKGTHEEKILMTGSIGNILATKFGDMSAVESLLISGQLEIIPTANIRGLQLSNAGVYVTEGQNLDIYTLKTIVQRCESGCKQIYEGDILEQTDVNISQSGIERMIDVFKGHPSFGCIKLKNNYRGDLTAIADKM